ncbi:MAG: T9SS type A sorting domain-containing protein [Bacteroidetes bacterium]|nr:T9SS type A sorting domain-containing protein [Bacteroidota bacterium]
MQTIKLLSAIISMICASVTLHAGAITASSCSVTIGCYQYKNASCPTCADGIGHSYASNGTAPYTYSWSTSPVQTTSAATGLLPGSYTVCATDANGCTACCVTTITAVTCSITVGCYQFNPASCAACPNGTGHSYASGGTAPYTFTWNTIPVQTTQTATGLLPGTYLVCATDANGCSSCCSTTITDSSVCTLTLGCYAYQPASCNTCADGIGHSYASNGTAPYTFSWSNGATTSTATGLLPGTYTVCVTDAKNCTACCSTTILDTSTCNITIGCYQYLHASCPTCADGIGHSYASNGTAPYTYSWSTSPVQNTPSATGLLPGTYTVCATDAKNCTACCVVTITYSTTCNLNVACYQYHSATCPTCADGSVHAYASNGTAPYTYLWSTSPVQNTPSATGLLPGTYTVCVTDANGCTACCTTTVTSTYNSCQAYFYLYPDTSLPHTYWAINYATSTNPPITYSWNWGDNTTSIGAYPTHTYANAGVYTICLTITDAVGCSSTFCRTDSVQKSSDPHSNDIITVNVIADATGVNQLTSEISYANIYPVPNNGNFTLAYRLPVSKSELQVTDIMGKIIYTYEITGAEGNQRIAVPNLENSIYYWQIISSDGILNKGKIVVIR